MYQDSIYDEACTPLIFLCLSADESNSPQETFGWLTEKTRSSPSDTQAGGEVEFNQLQPGPGEGAYVDARRHPRFKIDLEITIYSHTCGMLRGRSVDISESGIAAMLRMDVPLGEVVRLEFTLPLGPVEIEALVKQQNAFRFGFEFVGFGPARELIERTCRRLFVDRMILEGSHPDQRS